MKLHRKPITRTNTNEQLQRLVKGFELITSAIEQALRVNTVISDDERDTIVSGCEEVTTTLREVLSRTLQQSPLTETTQLSRMKDSELLAKFEGCQTELYYVVDLATTLLERMLTFGYMKDKEYRSLQMFWRAVLRQHQILGTKFKKATNT